MISNKIIDRITKVPNTSPDNKSETNEEEKVTESIYLQNYTTNQTNLEQEIGLK